MGRSSGLTISSAVESLTISPPSTTSSSPSNGGSSSRRGSGDPVAIPSHILSPSSTSNASTPRIHEQPLHERKSTIKNDHNEKGHRRKNSNGRDDGIVPSNKHHIQSRRQHQQQHLHQNREEIDVTPRSVHSVQNQSSLSTSSLPPSKFTFENNWKCENRKCGEMNPIDINYCNFCAIKRGATGERGSGAKLYSGT